MKPALALIAAVARNGTIGDGHTLPWRLAEDMAFFRQTTHGHSVLMGRRTWDSLPSRFRPLPGRRNIVLSRDPRWRADGADHAASLPAALALAADADQLFVIGGAQVYAQALPLAQRLLLTEIDADFDGDVVFPSWDHFAFVESWCTHHESAEGLHYRRRSLERKPDASTA